MKTYQVVNKVRGYEANREPTNITEDNTGVLISPSKNCYILDSGVVESRAGITQFGTASGHKVTVADTWVNNRGLEIPFRTTGGKFQIYFNEDWIDISNITNEDIDYTTWWDNGKRRDILLFVQGDDSVYSFVGAIANITAVNGTQITIDRDTHRAGFFQYDAVIIDGIEYTIQSIDNIDKMTLNNAPPASASIIHSKVESSNIFSYTIALDANTPPADYTNRNLKNDLDFVFDTILSVNNQVYYGCHTHRRVFISNNTNYKDMTFDSPRTSGQGDSFVLDAPVVKFVDDASQGRVIALCKQDHAYEIKQRTLDTTPATFYTSVRKLRTGYGSGVYNKHAVANVKYTVAFANVAHEIDTVGRLESIDTTQARPLSDKIKTDFDALNFDDVVLFFYKNSLFVSLPNEKLVYEYDYALGLWQAPYTLDVTAFNIVNGKLVVHDSQGASHYLFEGTTDNGSEIESVIAFNYRTFNERYNKKQFHTVGVEGYINETGKAQVQVTYDYGGVTGNVTYDIYDGAENVFSYKIPDNEGFGRVGFGRAGFGGVVYNSQFNDSIMKFRLLQELDPKDFYDIQIQLKTSEPSTRFMLVSYGLNVKLSQNNAIRADGTHIY